MAVDHATIRRALFPLISTYARVDTLDVGAGRLAWRDLLAAHGNYVPSDIEASHPDIALLFDIQKPFPVEDARFTTLLCCSVLEHVPEPWHVLSEFRRVLKPGGHVILSVPFIYHIHAAPHDYWRFSPFGVRQMADKAGLDVVSIDVSGGMAQTMAHIVSVLLSSVLWHPRLRWPTFAVTALLSALSRCIDRFDGGAFPQSVNAVLRRPE